MCDRYRQSMQCPIEWNRRFYEEYLHQHNAMTQWVQQLNYNALTSCHSGYQNSYFNAPSANFCFHSTPNEPHASNHYYPGHHEHHQNYVNHTHQNYSYPSHPTGWTSHHREVPQQNLSSKKEGVKITSYFSSEENFEEEDRSDIIGSDDEICFNFDSIAALRAGKETSTEISGKSDASSEHSDDFELLDAVPDVEFEYVHLDKFGNKEKCKVGIPDTANEIEKEKERKYILYGDRASTVGGLETAVALDFNRHCDLYQPTLWPVLPLCL